MSLDPVHSLETTVECLTQHQWSRSEELHYSERKIGTLHRAIFQIHRFKFHFSYGRRGKSSLTWEEPEPKIYTITKSYTNALDWSCRILVITRNKLKKKKKRQWRLWNFTVQVYTAFQAFFLDHFGSWPDVWRISDKRKAIFSN